MLRPPFRFSSLRWADTVILPGVDDLARPIDAALVRAIRGAVDRGARVASICSGAFLLAATGALDGLRATTHWAALETMRKRFPQVKVESRYHWIEDGNVITSAGISAGIDMALRVVARYFGEPVARNTAQRMEYPYPESDARRVSVSA